MTAAQQKSRERFKKAIAEAKKLRKKNPKLSQAQAVKQAWAILYSSGKVNGVKQKKAKYKVGDKVYSYQNKIIPATISYMQYVFWDSKEGFNKKDVWKYKLKLYDGYSNWINEDSLSKKKISGIDKKTAVKKKAAVKKSSYHKDTKSHNVNIKVMSGVGNIYKVRDNIEQDIKYYLEAIEKTKKNIPEMSILEKKRAKEVLINWKKIIIKLKKQLRDQNKLINDLLK